MVPSWLPHLQTLSYVKVLLTRKVVKEGVPTQANNHCAREDILFVEHPLHGEPPTVWYMVDTWVYCAQTKLKYQRFVIFYDREGNWLKS